MNNEDYILKKRIEESRSKTRIFKLFKSEQKKLYIVGFIFIILMACAVALLLTVVSDLAEKNQNTISSDYGRTVAKALCVSINGGDLVQMINYDRHLVVHCEYNNTIYKKSTGELISATT